MDSFLYKALTEYTTDAILVTEADNINTPDGPRIVYVNNAYLEMTGYDRKEVIGKTPRILQGPETDRKELDKLRYALENSERGYAELINYRKNGGKFWTSVNINPLMNGDNKPAYWLSTKRDITVQKEFELQQKLIKEIAFTASLDEPVEEVLSEIMHLICEFYRCSLSHIYMQNATRMQNRAISLDIWNKNIDSIKYSEFIKETKSTKFLPGEGMIGKAIDENDILHFNIEESGDEYFRRDTALQSGFKSCLMIPIKSKLDDVFTVIECYKEGYLPLSRSEYETLNVVKEIVQHLLERESSLQKVTEQRDRFEAVSKAINETIWDWDIRADTVIYNDALHTMFGYDKSEAENVSKWWRENIHPEDQNKIIDQLNRAAAGKAERIEMTYRYRCSDGSYKYINDRAILIRDSDRNPVRMIGAMQDITSLVEREKRAESFRQAFFKLATDFDIMTGNDAEQSFTQILRVSAKVLQVSRANIWLLNDGLLHCISSYENDDSEHLNDLSGVSINIADQYPVYFDYIINNRILAVNNAQRDNRTKELADDYLIPQNIYSLLDIPVILSGSVIAMICFEQTGNTRDWKNDEIVFANDVGDLLAQVFANSKTKKKEEELQKTLGEREVLLQEIHHRVKNNLAVISAMIHLQAFEEENENIRSKLLDSTTRIGSIASIHEQLYQSENFSNLHVGENIRKLILQIMKVLQTEVQIETEFRMNEIFLNINQAVPFTLIVNEVITNIIKHAFPGKKKGKIEIELSEIGRQVRLIIKDDGIGLPKNFNFSDSSTIGMKLIETLSQQINSEYKFESSDKGTVFKLIFEKTEIKGSSSSLLDSFPKK